jgi:UDP-N-acetylmuramoyl-tripeptide--D-alanyl-D-alanine ligase
MAETMKNMTLAHIAEVCGGTYIGEDADKEKTITGAVIDSRLVEAGYLFIPIRGARADGHDFIPDVFAKGALAVLSEKLLENPQGPYILVGDTQTAMKQLAADYRRGLSVKVVGITGSVGKTSTKEMIAAVLSRSFRVLKTEGNLNNEIGLPLTIFKIREEHEVAVLEMGISEFGEMHRLAEMAQPDICVITNIGLCHLENLHTRDGILKAKTESFEHLAPDGIAVLNGDDDKLCEITEVNGRPPLFYGIEKEPRKIQDESGERELAAKAVYATEIKAVGLDQTNARIHVDGESFLAHIPIAGEHNVYNALAAVCVGRTLGMSLEEIQQGIASVQTIGGRSNLIQRNDITIIDDCYNANPVSMQASIDVLANAPGRKIAVLGDMGELGTEEKALHAMVGKHFEGKEIDALFCVGTLSEEIAKAAKKSSPSTRVYLFDDKEALVESLNGFKRPGDTILVKASHFMGFSEIVEKI